jgi:hypothetical protein
LAAAPPPDDEPPDDEPPDDEPPDDPELLAGVLFAAVFFFAAALVGAFTDGDGVAKVCDGLAAGATSADAVSGA